MQNNSEKIQAGSAALELFFARPDDAGVLEFDAAPAIRLTAGLFSSFLRPDPGRAAPHHYLNAIARDPGPENYAPALLEAAFDVLIDHGVLPAELTSPSPGPDAEFLLNALADLFIALRLLTTAINRSAGNRLLPAARAIAGDLNSTAAGTRTAVIGRLAGRLADCDRFSRQRVFRISGGKLSAVHPDSAKPLDKFFGFPGVRANFAEHFQAFASGRSNIPLLVYSLPGYGKTSLTISHAVATPGAVLILAAPELLETGWRPLMDELARRTDCKFVVFFDDIDPRNVDWYNFRTNVGGAFSLPDNVMPVLSSNYEFPAGILSRGRQLSFPVFDELRCTEMIEDFLRDFGLKRIPRNLVYLIGAGYTEEFGQKKFAELSPRTLMRYLATFESDQEKRRTIAEMSLGEMVAKPDSELFYEFNIELMRSLYGEEYIQRLLKEKLRNLS